MEELRGIVIADKAAAWNGYGVYYAYSDGAYIVIDPKNGALKEIPPARFKEKYAIYSENLPDKIKVKLGAMPSFRAWKAARAQQCARGGA